MIRYIHIIFVSLLFHSILLGWGGNTHKFINKNAVIHLPASMQSFSAQAAFFETHAADADGRGGLRHLDTNFYGEYWRHFLDLDNYPNYKNLSPDLWSLVSTYGRDVVRQNGTSWWATVWVMDSLTDQLNRKEWSTAYQTAADLGHYIGDMHQPLHATGNYNGYATGNDGIHSRYETTMMNKYLSTITVTKDSARYIKDPLSYIFQYIVESNSFTDSVMAADRYAAPPSGYDGTGSLPTDYYAKLWERTQGYTKVQVQKATIALANLWYTAYVNSGLLNTTGVKKMNSLKPKNFTLRQNFPNPFNPATKIEFDIAKPARAMLEIYSVDGKLVTTLVDASLETGSYSVEWDAKNVPSGLYFYRLTAGEFSITKKLVVVK